MKITSTVKAHFELTKKEQIENEETLAEVLKTTVATAKKLSDITKVDSKRKVNSTGGLVRMETLTINEHLALALNELNQIEVATEAASEVFVKESASIADSIGASSVSTEAEVATAQSIARNKYQATLVSKNYILNNVGIVDNSSEL